MGETDCRGNWVLFWWAGPFSVNLNSIFCWWEGLCSLPLFDLRVNYSRGNKDNVPSFKRLCTHCCIQCPWLLSRPLLTHTSAGDCWTLSQASLAQSLVGTLHLSPGSWYTQGFICALQESVSPVLWKFYHQIPLASKINFPRDSQSLCQIPGWKVCCGS